MKSKLFVLASFVILGTLFLFAGGPYKITRILPNQKILIGKKHLGVDDIFYEDQVVHWDPKLVNQAFEADDINDPAKTIAMSKVRTRKESTKDISYSMLASLISKGNDDIKLLWPGDSVQINIQVDTTFTYKLHINGTYDYKELMMSGSSLFIKPEAFDTLSGIVKYDIVRIKGYDIEIVKYGEVELIK